jgi:hypothetical protein
MANSTYFYTVNRCLAQSGQRQVPDANSFNSSTTLLSRVQQQCREFVDIANRELLLDMNKRFMQREYKLTTAIWNGAADATSTPTSNNIYSLDTSTDAESLIYHSFYNKTPQSALLSGLDTGKFLRNWDYREFRSLYPDFSQLVSGPPTRWILLPQQSSQPVPSNTIMFFPPPDAVYTIIYQAKIGAAPLVKDTDIILWPEEYEHILWMYARKYLETALGEGKEGNIEAWAEKAVAAMKKWAGGPEEQRHAVKLGIQVEGIARGRRVSKYFTST